MGRFSTHSSTLVNRFAGLLLALFVPLALAAQVSVSTTSTNVTCFGLCNGKASAVGSGGWAPYTYLWSTGATTQNVAGLCPGTYTVTVTDIDLGYAVGTVVITQPPQLGVTAFGTDQICDSAPEGTATAVPYGGTPPYTYQWSNGGSTAIITGLTAGTYTVTVTDANNCTAAASATVVFFNEGVWLMISSTPIICHGDNNGTAHVSPMSGTPPYIILWSNGQSGETITNLGPGTYSVTVTDQNGCSNFTSTTVTEPPLLTGTTSSTPAACGNTGTATVFPTGGTPPYGIQWHNGGTTPTIIGLAPGPYFVTVTDANDCTFTASVTVGGNNTPLNVTGTVISNAGCNIGGSASASASGGSGNYVFVWDNGQMGVTATNLTAGNHSVTATDIATGCIGIGIVNIPSAPTLTATVTVNANANCTVGGSATVTASGGTPPYGYLWDNGQTTATATNLGAGPHSVTVTDATGCIVIKTVTIGQAQGPTVTAVVNTNATCTTGGSATATATGGSGGYVYLWSNGQTTATATNLGPGQHMVTVTDAGGCSASASVTITQANSPSITAVATGNANCNGGGGAASSSASGGTAPYGYLWSNGQTTATISNLAPGTYTVTVTDAAGCTASAGVSIAAPLPPSVVITASTNANCSQPGSATAVAAGGAGGYAYSWSNGETTATAVNLAAGSHTVTVTDGAGCTGTASINIGFTNNGINVGDFVWYDNDQNGSQEAGEPGVPNITVKLIKAGPDGLFMTSDDITVATTTTNGAGLYLFNCVTPGTYIIMFSGIPSGYEFTDKDKVNDCFDSDANANGKTAPFTVVAGQADNLCMDAGIHTICDNVLNAGTICCNQTICEGEQPTALYGVTPPSGGSGAIEYQWLQLVQMGPAQPTWVGIPGATNASYSPGALFETSYFMRCARRAGCLAFLESNIVTITVKPAGSPGCGSFLQQFTVSALSKYTVQVEWVALPEPTQYLYTVEHSTDQLNWHSVTTVMGHQDALNPNQYTIKDDQAVSGQNFYRIRRANAGGQENLSDPEMIDLSLPVVESMAIFPNPVVKSLTVRNMMVYDDDVTVTICSTNGDVIETLTIRGGELQTLLVDMGDRPVGLYLAHIQFSNGDRKTVKITKMQ
ncbi:MAG: hypothetical protein IT259_17345 [Saprospiraceae bacterium]|nr:hypothetical protein [Saprospiraceae bacterium]